MDKVYTLRLDRVTYAVPHEKDQLVIVDGISATWKPGITRALWGVSGAGKSTLLHLIAGFQLPTSGLIWYGDRPHDALTESERLRMRRSEIGYVMQSSLLIPECSVLENIMLGGLIAGLSVQQCTERAYELLNAVGLSAKAHCYPLMLSGGEQQRVVIMRAVWSRPQWLLVDEPTSHLDGGAKKQMVDLLLNAAHSIAGGMIVATHDRFVADAMDEVWVLRNGRLAQE